MEISEHLLVGWRWAVHFFVKSSTQHFFGKLRAMPQIDIDPENEPILNILEPYEPNEWSLHVPE
jgi:hypothetical protein